MRKYETIIVIDSLLKTEEIEGIISKYERFISANGGVIEVVDRWGKRRLAYEIKKRQYGIYVLIRFDAPSAMIKQLDREYRLNEYLLRTMTTKLDKRALTALSKQTMAMPPKPAAIEVVPEVQAVTVMDEVEAPKVAADEVEAPKVAADDVEAPKVAADDVEAPKVAADEAAAAVDETVPPAE